MDAEEVVTETTVPTAVEQSLTALLEAGYGNWTVRQALMLLLLKGGGCNEVRHLAPRLKTAKAQITRAAICLRPNRWPSGARRRTDAFQRWC